MFERENIISCSKYKYKYYIINHKILSYSKFVQLGALFVQLRTSPSNTSSGPVEMTRPAWYLFVYYIDCLFDGGETSLGGFLV